MNAHSFGGYNTCGVKFSDVLIQATWERLAVLEQSRRSL